MRVVYYIKPLKENCTEPVVSDMTFFEPMNKVENSHFESLEIAKIKRKMRHREMLLKLLTNCEFLELKSNNEDNFGVSYENCIQL